LESDEANSSYDRIVGRDSGSSVGVCAAATTGNIVTANTPHAAVIIIVVVIPSSSFVLTGKITPCHPPGSDYACCFTPLGSSGVSRLRESNVVIGFAGAPLFV